MFFRDVSGENFVTWRSARKDHSFCGFSKSFARRVLDSAILNNLTLKRDERDVYLRLSNYFRNYCGLLYSLFRKIICEDRRVCLSGLSFTMHLLIQTRVCRDLKRVRCGGVFDSFRHFSFSSYNSCPLWFKVSSFAY